MVTTDRAPGDPCWIDLMTDSIDRSRDFYHALFGWEFQDLGADTGHYHFILHDGEPVGGAMQNSVAAAAMPDDLQDTLGNYWTIYLTTPDIDALEARARQRGIVPLFPAMQVLDQGWNLSIRHPAIGLVGAWQPLEFPGFGETGAPGTPVWFELHTPRFQEAQTLLSLIFDWEISLMSDTPGPRYAQHHEGAHATAGIFDMTSDMDTGTVPETPADPEAPASWRTYIQVADIHGSLDTVESLGGAVTRAAEDTPFGILAEISDDQGAVLRLAQDAS